MRQLHIILKIVLGMYRIQFLNINTNGETYLLQNGETYTLV